MPLAAPTVPAASALIVILVGKAMICFVGRICEAITHQSLNQHSARARPLLSKWLPFPLEGASEGQWLGPDTVDGSPGRATSPASSRTISPHAASIMAHPHAVRDSPQHLCPDAVYPICFCLLVAERTGSRSGMRSTMVTYSATVWDIWETVVTTLSHTGKTVCQAQCGSSHYPPTSYGTCIQMGRFRGWGDSNQETQDSNR